MSDAKIESYLLMIERGGVAVSLIAFPEKLVKVADTTALFREQAATLRDLADKIEAAASCPEVEAIAELEKATSKGGDA